MSSRIPGFYRLPPQARLERVALACDLPASSRDAYHPGGGLPMDVASLMVENVIGVMSLPVGVALNMVVNGKDYLIPMVLEEPSVVAAISHMAKVTREVGGVQARADDGCMIGQIQLRQCRVPNPTRCILDEQEDLIEEANALIPGLTARGGGVRGVEVRTVCFEEDGQSETMVIVHFLVNTRDAMGANIVNTVVEGMASRVASLAGAAIGLRILSNLADRRLVRASVRIGAEHLERPGYSGQTALEGVIAADRFAVADPYRAATHNKGIMNGIDAVALATGNDWRALEAGAHAFAASSGRYRPLSRWREVPDGVLWGELEMPMQVGIVGGPMRVHPTVRANLHVLGVESANELAEVMAAVGLAQNLGALLALGTEGIQRGHMSMHARNVAASADVPYEWIPDVVRQMVAHDAIDLEGAREAYSALKGGESRAPRRSRAEVLAVGQANGKVILFGEHAVVHGYSALASAIDRGVCVTCRQRSGDAWLEAPGILTAGPLFGKSRSPVRLALQRVFELVGAPKEGITVEVDGDLPPGKGLGSSAALGIAALRSVSRAIGRTLEEPELLDLGHQVEQLFHGLPSGLDHTVATRGGVLRFRRGHPPLIETIAFVKTFHFVLLDSGEVGPTSLQVSSVLSQLEDDRDRVTAAFEAIERLVDQGVAALQAGDGEGLAIAMNKNHTLLQELRVSTARLDELVAFARAAGATGAKLTGAGGGGMVLALCLDGVGPVLRAAQNRGITVYPVVIPDGGSFGSHG